MNTRTTKVTISIADLKTAFRRVFPEQSAKELRPAWEKFWAGVVIGGRIEVALPVLELRVNKKAPELTDEEVAASVRILDDEVKDVDS